MFQQGSIILCAVAVFCSIWLIFPPLAMANGEKSSLQKYVEDMHPGWNLGNTFDATGSETSWGNPRTTQELIDAIADQGFKSIRIPVTWGHRLGEAPNYQIDETFLDRVASVVRWALDNDLYVMLNMHHDTDWISAMEENQDEVLAKFEAAWTQIATYFRDYPLQVMFESLNEPRFDDDWGKDTPLYFAMLNRLNLSFHRIVRGSGGLNLKRPLVLSTMTASGTQTRMDELLQTMEELQDDQLIATIHYYGHWPFSVNVAGATKFDQTVKLDVIGTLDRAYHTFVERGIPVIIGEYGLLGFDKDLGTIQHGELLKFFEFLTYYGQELKMPLMLWDNGQHFQRRLLRWSDPQLYSVIMVDKGVRSSFTESDSIFLKKNVDLKDRQLRLELNGNELIRVLADGQELRFGIDYDMAFGRLVIKQEFLGEISQAKLGVAATVTCEFSDGNPWEIKVIIYDKPLFANSEGVTNRFKIPVQFNGDRLLTMEATYVNGGNAGPHDWTSYKEFGHCFKPSYNSNNIEITQAFFREIKDDEPVLLKFHFGSGEVVKYEVTKNKMKVSGIQLID